MENDMINLSNILILFPIALFSSYVVVLSILNGKITVDITHLIYVIEEKLGKNWMWITPVVYSVCSISFGVRAFMEDKWYLTVPLLLCAIFFFMVGVFPDVRKNNDRENVIHVAGAILAIIFGIVYSVLSGSWYFTLAFLLFALAIKKQIIKIKHKTFWLEFWAFFVIVLSALKKKK